MTTAILTVAESPLAVRSVNTRSGRLTVPALGASSPLNLAAWPITALRGYASLPLRV